MNVNNSVHEPETHVVPLSRTDLRKQWIDSMLRFLISGENIISITPCSACTFACTWQRSI